MLYWASIQYWLDIMDIKKGRGACSNEKVRFEAWSRDTDARDEWDVEDNRPVKTTIMMRTAKSIISHNQSPDIPFEASINPLQGCEHGCVYCFARPSHEYLGLSAGLNFETKLFAKENSAELLRAAFSRRKYSPALITLGTNTDVYQPAEKKLGLTRGLLQVFEEHQHPVSIITKSALILRDVDILARLARNNLVSVNISVTTLDNELSRTLEPRASAPGRRLMAIRQLTEAGVPVRALVAPIIPVITDFQLEAIIKAVAEAGARSAGYVLLRLPHEVEGLFKEWLEAHHPLKLKHVLARLADMGGGSVYNSTFGQRMKGTGPFADLLQNRFRLACRRNGLADSPTELRTDLFSVPSPARATQLDLF